MLFHVWWIFGTHFCDIALDIFILNCIFICGRFVIFWVRIFFVTAIFSNWNGLLLLCLFFLIFFVFYVFIHVLFIFWMVVNWVIWVHSWNGQTKIVVIVGAVIITMGVGIFIIRVVVLVFIVQLSAEVIVRFVYILSDIPSSKGESDWWLATAIQGMNTINNFNMHWEFGPAVAMNMSDSA